MFPEHLLELHRSADPRENDRLPHTAAYQAIQARQDADFVLDALDASAQILDQPVVSIETLSKLDEHLSEALGKAAIKTYEAAVMFELARVARPVNLGLAMARASRAFVLAETSERDAMTAHDTDSVHKLRDIMQDATDMQREITAVLQSESNQLLRAA